MSNKLEYIHDLLKSCEVPALKQDLDSIHIASEHFADYRQRLKSQLPLLYDFVQQQKSWIFRAEDVDTDANADAEEVEVYSLLIALLCEITAPCEAYKLDNGDLIRNAHSLLDAHIEKIPRTAEQRIIEHYQIKLHKDCWKRQLGSVHGFMQYLELRFNRSNSKYKMSKKWLTFCLSVGLRVRECYEPIYKQMGTRIFELMLRSASHTDIVELNVHSVIYDAVQNKDVHFMDSVTATAGIWNCLYLCLDFFDNMDSLSWSHVDDMLDTLVSNIPLAPNCEISICMLQFVTKLNAYFAINSKEIEDKYNADLSVPAQLEACRCVCATKSSYTPFRWAKTILNLLVVESYKLLQDPLICQQLLQEMHRCYMVCILPIGLSIIAPQLLPFFDKFTTVLMEVIIKQERQAKIVELIKCVLNTFLQQLNTSAFVEKNEQVQTYRTAFEQLLLHEIFVL